jgi:hypothetical protein
MDTPPRSTCCALLQQNSTNCSPLQYTAVELQHNGHRTSVCILSHSPALSCAPVLPHQHRCSAATASNLQVLQAMKALTAATG